ncbi:MAG TPA: TMEM175 family protein [Solirubrobacteraceae bacterium]|nr:TMEM175 family protein [Solirubrobacteraceae bacterium]
MRNESQTQRSLSEVWTTRDLLPKGRLEAFSDGVLAIVITILVLELKVPGLSEDKHLAQALGHEWRSFAGYLISFVFVGGVWIAHANATRLIKLGDQILYRLVLLQLFFVSLLPYMTSLMTAHLGVNGQRIAVPLYGLDLLLASVMLNIVIRYLGENRELVIDEIADEELHEIAHQRRSTLTLLAIATALAVVLPSVAVALYLLATIGFVIAPLQLARRRRRARARRVSPAP